MDDEEASRSFDTNWLNQASKREVQIVVAALQLAITDLVDDAVDGHEDAAGKQAALKKAVLSRIANLDIVTRKGKTDLSEEAASIGYTLKLLEMIFDAPRQRSSLR